MRRFKYDGGVLGVLKAYGLVRRLILERAIGRLVARGELK